jgi:ParB-like nuclease domain
LRVSPAADGELEEAAMPIIGTDTAQAKARYPLHPLCELFPPMEGAAFDELVASIRAIGLQEPIMVLDGAILDGRNRYNACLAAGVEPVFTPFRDDDPVKFVIAANVHRRHLNESQRAMIAAKLATLEVGANQHHEEGASIEAPSQSQAAEMLNVSRSSVQRARHVREHADPEDVKAISEGKATVSGVEKKLKPTKPPAPTEPERANALSSHLTAAINMFEKLFDEWLAAGPAPGGKRLLVDTIETSAERLTEMCSEIATDKAARLATEPAPDHRDKEIAKLKARVAELEMLSPTAQKKLECAMRAHQKKIDAEFEERVQEDWRKRMTDFLPHYAEKIRDADAIRDAYRGVFSRAEFRLIQACLHPDRSMSDEKLAEAFRTFTQRDSVLVTEDRVLVRSKPLPKTVEEFMEMGRRADEARRAKRNQAKAAKAGCSEDQL